MHYRPATTKYFFTKLILLLLLVLVPVYSTALETDQIPEREIVPTDVFQLVSKVRAELELLRFHMGKPKTNASYSVFLVQNAEPREVFYQAITLFEKSNQFAFDQIRVRNARPKTPKSRIQPSDVYNVVNQALAHIREVKAELGISTVAIAPVPDLIHTPTDVFLAIIQSNRQLNLLLDQRFAPKDVFRQISQAIGYSARLLAHFPNSKRIPHSESLQQGKRPIDVFQRLVSCYHRIRTIGEQSGLAMLDLNTHATNMEIMPSDVYTIASLIVSELAYMHTKLADAHPPRPVFDPGRKFPSHVFQRASILESQLEALEIETKRSPLWLSHSSELVSQ